jgi:hypothetical protein
MKTVEITISNPFIYSKRDSLGNLILDESGNEISITCFQVTGTPEARKIYVADKQKEIALTGGTISYTWEKPLFHISTSKGSKHKTNAVLTRNVTDAGIGIWVNQDAQAEKMLQKLLDGAIEKEQYAKDSIAEKRELAKQMIQARQQRIAELKASSAKVKSTDAGKGIDTV